MRAVFSRLDDVHANLALEEVLGAEAEAGRAALFFCVNAPCVVIGKNQNPWRECDLDAVERGAFRLARRVTGGGAVYHDAGNLNYSVIVPRTRYRREQVVRAMLGALLRMGVRAESGRNHGLFVGERKFSGTAFAHRRNTVVHHGTMLIAADLDRLRAALRPSLPGLVTRAIASVPSPVVNLAELLPGLTARDLAGRLAEAFSAEFGETVRWDEPAGLDGAAAARAAEHAAWAWVYGHTPSFEARSGTDLRVHVVDGLVETSDDPALAGRPFTEIWRAFV